MPAIDAVTRRELTELEIDRAGVREFYEHLLSIGNDPEFAAMLALRQPPGTRFTDRAFCEGQRRKMEQMTPANRKMLQEAAAKAGIDTNGKFYVGGLGTAMDKAAWVTTADDVVKACQTKNLNMDGVLKHKATPADTPPRRVRMAKDVQDELIRKRLEADPSMRQRISKKPQLLREIREEVVAKHSKKPPVS